MSEFMGEFSVAIDGGLFIGLALSGIFTILVIFISVPLCRKLDAKIKALNCSKFTKIIINILLYVLISMFSCAITFLIIVLSISLVQAIL
ncbi:MAG: hypothetical protein IJM31_01815 [Campylobacter sp.]|nr:hypothetical protein [Campylobacter sp.]MBP3208275.1 hypothetical protein [Campylobacter sp.]MBQ7271616.1 hypothetical protein [Campylobacter sp.]MBQ9875806.1 hypothetical protein [Campylobacter sp.]